MPRKAAAPLAAGIVTRTAVEATRIGITVRLPEAVHEQLRVLAFEQRTSKQAIIEGWIVDQLTKMAR